MQLEIVQEFNESSPNVIAAYRSLALYEAFHDLPFVGKGSVITHRSGGDSEPTVNHTRWTVELQLPAAAKLFVDPDRLSFVEQMKLSVDGTGSFRVVPDHYSKLLRFSGTTVVAGDATRTTRTTKGELRVDLGWQGKLFESDVTNAIAAGLTRALKAQVPQVQTFIASN